MGYKLSHIIACLLVLFTCTVQAQKYNKTYAAKSIARANGVIVNKNGEAICVGAVADVTSEFIQKVNANGDTLWLNTQQIGKGGANIANCIAKLNNGKYLVGGLSRNAADTAARSFLIWITEVGKIDTIKNYGHNSNNTRCYAVKQRPNGNIALTGYKYKKGQTAFTLGDLDVYLIGTDSIGNQQWEKQYGGAGDDYIQSMDITSDGGYILGGQTTSFGGPKCYLIKTDSLGNLKWQKTYDNGLGSGASKVITTLDGGYLLSGACNFNAQHYSAGYLIKTDSAGVVQWQHQYQGISRDAYFDGVKQLPSGEFVVSGGQTQDTLNTKYYGWLVKVNPTNGNIIWQRTYSYYQKDSTQHYFYDMDLSPDGGFVMCGMVLDYSSTAVHGNQVWLVKTDSAGNTITNGIQELGGKFKPLATFTLAPNPATTNSILTYQLTQPMPASVTVSDIAGKVLKTYTLAVAEKGQITLDAIPYPQGVYFCTLLVQSKPQQVMKWVVTK